MPIKFGTFILITYICSMITTDRYKNIKTGQYVYMGDKQYLFLGYSDYPRKRAVIADKFGNKAEVWVTQINLTK